MNTDSVTYEVDSQTDMPEDLFAGVLSILPHDHIQSLSFGWMLHPSKSNGTKIDRAALNVMLCTFRLVLKDDGLSIDVSRFTSLSRMTIHLDAGSFETWERCEYTGISSFLKAAHGTSRHLSLTVDSQPSATTRKGVIEALQNIGQVISAECTSKFRFAFLFARAARRCQCLP